MKLTNLLKKMATTFLAIAVVGMLAACSSSSGSSDNNNNDGYDYSIIYDDIFLFGTNTESYPHVKKYLTEGNYTETDNTLKLTDAGFDELLDSPMMKERPGDVYVAIVAYNKRMLMPVTQDEYTLAASELTLNDDYKVTHDDRVVELTASGYQKGAALFGDED